MTCTDYLIGYATATFTTATCNYQVASIVGVEFGREDWEGQGQLRIGDLRRHDRGGNLKKAERMWK